MNSPISADAAAFPQGEIDRLEFHVHRRLGGQVRDFRLTIYGDRLILRGRAATYYAKQLAQHAIMEATQVPIAANNIEVSSSPR